MITSDNDDDNGVNPMTIEMEKKKKLPFQIAEMITSDNDDDNGVNPMTIEMEKKKSYRFKSLK